MGKTSHARTGFEADKKSKEKLPILENWKEKGSPFVRGEGAARTCGKRKAKTDKKARRAGEGHPPRDPSEKN